MKFHRTPTEDLAEVERKITRLQRVANAGLTCCGEIGGIRNRSRKRKDQIAERRVNASVALVKLYRCRDALRATIERQARGEPEPRPKLREALQALKPQRAPHRVATKLCVAPKVTATLDSEEGANRYMETHPGEGLLREFDGRFEMARMDDAGSGTYFWTGTDEQIAQLRASRAAGLPD